MFNVHRSVLNLTIIFLLFSLILSSSILLVEKLYFSNSIQKFALENAVKKTKERAKVFENFLNTASKDLHSINESVFFREYLNSNNNVDVKNLFLTLMDSHINYMQLRFIDKNGMETIRIDRKEINGEPFVVLKNQLQDKSNRYYFTDSKQKEPNKVWFSRLDLNIENGKIEVPYNPTLRAIFPIKHNNQFGGILIINYFMKDFITKFTRAPLYDMTVFDDQGFVIHHAEHKYNTNHNDKCFGNCLEHKYNIANDFPNSYKEILSSDLVHTDTYVSRKMKLPIDGGLNIVLQLNKDFIQKEEIQQQNQYFITALIIFVLSLIMIFIIIKLFSKKILNIEVLLRTQKELKELNISLEQKVESRTRQIESILNLQENIVILTDGKKLRYANQSFFKFLSFNDLENFLKKHDCICEFFLDNNDRFFHLGKIDADDNWVDELEKLQHSQRIVSMLGPSFIVHVFSVSINLFDNELKIISFTDITKTIERTIHLENKTIHDKLTNAYNREFFEQNIYRLIQKYNTENTKLAIALLDIDHFKLVNDTFGHDVGDDVLVHFVKTVKKFSRDDDIFIRWGGEEFVLVLKVKSNDDLAKALEHLRKVIEIEKFPTVGQKTCSIGGTIYKDHEDIDVTIKRADKAVYDAKATGRNKVVLN